ncbi:threonylcarbamoyl-AMP synthase [Ligilactobacillus pobuzihii]|uniref:L-threonylcarbamoyladenylate synthase n=1 Tax=Ligilactobacillus pobuzihii TaxID=449659 RepID=UPI0019D0ADF9|nr:L-threonylcarbamoyladenylate synthase [Ligilactobacillus pobuzihii]MBN7273668.1 threonylcarbamoyl-AMP synthase [Ligilactobacillus pobuzihii]
MMITKMFSPTETSQAAEEIKLGELVAFPTETVYGLGADATNEQAVKRVYLAKGRPSDNPLIVTVSSPEMAADYIADYGEYGHELIKTFWPGPLTIVFKIKPGSLSPVVTGGLTTAAFRMPENETTRKMIAEAGVPIVGPSANSSGKPSPTTAQHVFHDMEGKIAGILDDGPTKVGVESTIIDLSASKPAVLRPGGITPQQIEAVIGCSVDASQHKVGAKETPKAPGMKYKHYAPAAQVLIVAPNDWQQALDWASKQGEKVGVMALTKTLNTSIPKNVVTYDMGGDLASATHRLFDGLRYFDNEQKVNWILACSFEEKGLGAAYMNRLKKSSGDSYFEPQA